MYYPYQEEGKGRKHLLSLGEDTHLAGRRGRWVRRLMFSIVHSKEEGRPPVGYQGE